MLADRRILLVEDDHTAAQTFTDVLEESGCQVWHVDNGADALALADRGAPDLIVLDVMLPDVDGLVLCTTLRAKVNVPIIICSGTLEKRDTVLSLKLGADDVISKPYDADVLRARVEAVLRRADRPRLSAGSAAASPDTICIDTLQIDKLRREVSLAGNTIVLTPTEYAVLVALANRPGDVVSREELAQVVWNGDSPRRKRTLDAHLHRLRRKLLDEHDSAPRIVSTRGFGFSIQPAPAQP